MDQNKVGLMHNLFDDAEKEIRASGTAFESIDQAYEVILDKFERLYDEIREDNRSNLKIEAALVTLAATSIRAILEVVP